jgi:hypothetical protein
VIAMTASSVLLVAGMPFAAGSAVAAAAPGPSGLAPVPVVTAEPTRPPRVVPPPAGPVNPDIDDFTSCQGWDLDRGPVDNCEHPDPDPTPEPTPDPKDPCLPPAGPGGGAVPDLPLKSLRMSDATDGDLDLTTEEADCEVPTDGGGGVSFTG